MQRGIMRPPSLFLGSDVLEGVQYKRHNFKRKNKESHIQATHKRDVIERSCRRDSLTLINLFWQHFFFLLASWLQIKALGLVGLCRDFRRLLTRWCTVSTWQFSEIFIKRRIWVVFSACCTVSVVGSWALLPHFQLTLRDTFLVKYKLCSAVLWQFAELEKWCDMSNIHISLFRKRTVLEMLVINSCFNPSCSVHFLFQSYCPAST